MALLLLDFDVLEDKRHPLELLDNRLGRGAVADLGLFSVYLDEAGLEGGRFGGLELGRDRPVLLGDEGADFLLPLADQAQSDGLNPAGAQPLADFSPEQRADEIADKTVQDSARLLSLNLVLVNLPLVLK